MNLVEAFRGQAAACDRLGSPMYAFLLKRVADDIEDGGVCAGVLAGHENDPGPSALALRLAGSVHRLVLEGHADELAAYYPSVGGRWEADRGWLAFEAVLRDQSVAVQRWLESPPQTNEVGRAAALMGGLLQIGEVFAHPVRLFEIGSSAGLNLRADAFGYVDGSGRVFGSGAGPLVLHDAWRGRSLRPWPGLEIIERVGSDLRPVDVSTAEGRMVLTSYVWPDQTERHERLRRALAVASEHPAEVRREDAAGFVRGIELAQGTTTVLWHSVVWQYLSRDQQRSVTAALELLGTQADRNAPFAHLTLEPTRRTKDSDHEFLVVLQLWPSGERRVLGAAAAHGVPTTWVSNPTAPPLPMTEAFRPR